MWTWGQRSRNRLMQTPLRLLEFAHYLFEHLDREYQVGR